MQQRFYQVRAPGRRVGAGPAVVLPPADGRSSRRRASLQQVWRLAGGEDRLCGRGRRTPSCPDRRRPLNCRRVAHSWPSLPSSGLRATFRLPEALMPLAPPRPCRHHGCPAVSMSGFCPEHQRTYDRQRGTAAERGYDGRWRAYRADVLRRHPLCVQCQAAGQVRAATVVDHITPHRGDPVLMWAPTNHQVLCASHHSRKTSSLDGGFGNAPRRDGAARW